MLKTMAMVLALNLGVAADSLPPQVSQIFSKPAYQGSTWGLRVVDAATGKVLLDEKPSTRFYIGSVRKVFSVGLLLDKVGAEHRYNTPIYATGAVDEAGVLKGNLVLVASGDLTMGGRRNADGSLAITDFDHNEANSLGNAVLSKPDPLAGYRDLARQVAASGVTRVQGEVVIDDRLFVPFGFRDEMKVRPIFVNDNVVDVSLSPNRAGQRASLEVRPLSSAFPVENHLMTGAAGSAYEVKLEGGKVSGNLPLDFKPVFTGAFPLVQNFRIENPSNFARTVLIEALEKEGVEVDAPTLGNNPVQLLSAKNGAQLALLEGDRYADLARYILKVSYNMGADTSLVLWGLEHGVNNMKDALAREREVLTDKLGLEGDSFEFVDGSGGGPTWARNAAVTTMLSHLLREDFLQALPVLGVDGSLGFVTDFVSDASLAGARGQVRAKTGTYVTGDEKGLMVKGQALGGIVDARSGRRLIFQLVVNEVPVKSIEELMEIFQDQGRISAILWRDF